jgi:hypothetical protein
VNASGYEFLLTTQSEQGGWGYAPGQTPGVEPTSAVLIAAKKHHQEAAFQKAAAWLLDLQHEDGGWGLNREDPQSCWLTAWAVWALAETGHQGEATQRGIAWLLNESVLQISDMDDLAAGEKVANIDFSLRGWPWQPGEASWVEPTALSMLAFLAAGERTNSRLSEAKKYLENRRCPGGGWNVGNPVMFDSALPARAHPTAWGILALERYSPQAVLTGDIDTLTSAMSGEGGIMALAWGVAVLQKFGVNVEQSMASLTASQKEDGSWEGNPYITAVTLMAQQGGLN